MSKLTWGLLALVMCSSTAWSQDRPGKPEIRLDLPPLGVPASSYTWPSGMVTAFEADPMSTAVAITVLIDGGWSADPEGQAGVSHLLERAWWSSEVSPGVRIVDQMVNGYGCEVDSFVGHDVMRFTAVCPVTSVDGAMATMARLFESPLAGVDADVLAEEKRRIRTDGAVRSTLTRVPVQEWAGRLFKQLYPEGHPYHRDYLGDLDALTLQDVQGFAEQQLVAKNTTVAVAGGYNDSLREYSLSLVASNFPLFMMHPDLKPEQMKRYARGEYDEPDEEDPSHWWQFPADPADPQKSLAFARDRVPRIKAYGDEVPEPAAASEFGVYEGGADQSVVMVGWALPPSWKGADGEHRVLAKLIQAMIAQNLDEPYIDTFPGCFIIPGVQAATLTCAAVLKEGAESAGERIARRIVDQLTYVTDMGNRATVDIATGTSQVSVLSSLLWSFDTLGGVWGSRGYWLSSGVHFANETMAVTDVISSTPGASAERLIELTETLITRDRSRAVQIMPAQQDEVAIRGLAANQRNRDMTAQQGTYWNRLATRPAPLPRPADRVSDERINSTWSVVPEDKVRMTRIGGDLTVIAVSQSELPVSHFRLIVNNGRVTDKSENQVHHYGREFIRPDRVVRTEPPGFGAQFVAWRDDVHHQASIRASSTNMEQALWVLRELADGWRITTASKADWLRRQKKQFVSNWYDLDWHRQDLERQHLYGTHPIGDDVVWQDMEAWSELGTNEFKDMMRAKWRSDNATILVVGPEAPDKVISRVRAHFLSWTTPKPESDAWDPREPSLAPLPSSRAVHLLPRVGDTSDVHLTCRVDAAPEVRSALEHLVRQRAGSGWLSMISKPVAWPGGTSVLTFHGRLAGTDVGDTLGGWLAAMEADASALSDVDARGAAWRGAMDTSMSLSSYRLTAARYAATLGEGRPFDDGLAVRERVAGVTAEALKPLLSQCAQTAFIAVTGDEASAGAALQAAGIEHTVTNWDARGQDLHKAADAKGYAKEMKRRSKSK